MIRRYHRWLSVIFGLFLLWIATTGLLSQFGALYRDAQTQPAAAQMAQVTPAGFVCPATMTCRAIPDPDGAAAWVSFFHHLHAGEEFGAIGTTLSILSGFALLFFAVSGQWLYINMWRGRMVRVEAGKRVPGGKLFWR